MQNDQQTLSCTLFWIERIWSIYFEMSLWLHTFFNALFAPCWRSLSAHSLWPQNAAWCNGVCQNHIRGHLHRKSIIHPVRRNITQSNSERNDSPYSYSQTSSFTLILEYFIDFAHINSHSNNISLWGDDSYSLQCKIKEKTEMNGKNWGQRSFLNWKRSFRMKNNNGRRNILTSFFLGVNLKILQESKK